MKTNSVRSAMLAEYSVRVKILIEFLRVIAPWGCNINKIEHELEELGKSLRFLPFVGLVVKDVPAVGNLDTIPRSGEISYKIQGEKFCDWFNNLRSIEITEPKEGDVGFRLYEINPTCSVCKVFFFDGYGWLSNLQRQELREIDPEFASKIVDILLGKPLRRRPFPDTIKYFDVDDVCVNSKPDTRAYRLVSLKPFQVEAIVSTPIGWQKI